MENKIYLLKFAERSEYQQAARTQHVKNNDMQYYLRSTTVYATMSKKEAQCDCRYSNKASKLITYYIEETPIYYND